MSALNGIAVASLLLGLQVTAAVADDPPKLDVTTTCNAAAQFSIVIGRDKDACLDDERTAEGTRGTIGAATGTVGGILGVEERPRFREYVIREHRPSFGYEGDVRVGAVLPPRGVTLYAVPREYHVRPGYRYAIVNDRPVIVEPRSRRIVEIIE
jgi:Protein of unknown function (DUF1236)